MLVRGAYRDESRGPYLFGQADRRVQDPQHLQVDSNEARNASLSRYSCYTSPCMPPTDPNVDRYCAGLERTLYPPGGAGIVDFHLIGGRRVGQGNYHAGNVDETTAVRAPVSLFPQFSSFRPLSSPDLP